MLKILFMKKRRVVITGLGIWSCLGTGVEEVTKSLYAGKSGIGIDPIRKRVGYRSPLTGIVQVPQLKELLDRRMRAGLAEEGEYAYMATKEAMDSAGIDLDYLDKNEMGVFYGNDSSAKAVIETHNIIKKKRDTMLVGSAAVFQAMNSTVSMNLATIFRLRGANMTISAACASGSHAIGLGLIFIQHGLQDIVLCGGAQETNFYSMGSFDALSAFSTRVDNPTAASRPFDASRNGLIPSGGAASLILEDYEHAKQRGAKIFAEITGYGFSSNGKNISQPDDKGCITAMSRALQDAEIDSGDVDYINAHATSTPQGDTIEAIALDKLFGQTRPLVSSTKSMTGHECWMAGASEVLYSVLMMQNNFVAPNINFETPDEYSAKLNIATKAVDKKLNTVLSNSFGFGGTNSALIIKKI
jgi:3-oxoacyl-[acyl-carrier-protein] synthase-1